MSEWVKRADEQREKREDNFAGWCGVIGFFFAWLGAAGAWGFAVGTFTLGLLLLSLSTLHDIEKRLRGKEQK